MKRLYLLTLSMMAVSSHMHAAINKDSKTPGLFAAKPTSTEKVKKESARKKRANKAFVPHTPPAIKRPAEQKAIRKAIEPTSPVAKALTPPKKRITKDDVKKMAAVKPMTPSEVKEFAKYHSKVISNEQAENISKITYQMSGKQVEMQDAKRAREQAISESDKSKIKETYDRAKKAFYEYSDMAKQEIENLGHDIKDIWEQFKSKL